MGKKVSPAAYSLLRIVSSFGLTLAMNIYLLSFLLGGWLDRKFDIAPLFSLLLMFVALAMSFLYLYKQAVIAKEVEEENKKAEKENDRWYMDL